MKRTVLTLSCLLLSMSYSMFFASTSVAQAKTKASTPSSKQKPFKKLPEETTSYDDDLSFFERDIEHLDTIMKTMNSRDPKGLSWETSHGKYAIKEVANDQNNYELVIALPGFTSDDIKVTLNQTKQKNITYKSLEIFAKKTHTQEQQEETKTVDQKTQITRSEQFVSSSNINGKKSNIVYKDDELKMTFDLPDDVSDQSYTMTFDNDELKVSFVKKAPDTTSMVLKFKSNDSKELSTHAPAA